MPDLNSEIKKLALGTVQFGLDYGISNSAGKTSECEVELILDYCRDNKIDTLDTAFGYGVSEQVLGKFDLQDFKIVSKFIDFDATGLTPEQQLFKSFENLKVNKLYGYIAHRPLLVKKRDWEALESLKALGKIKKIGFSFNQPEEINIVLNNGFIPDLVQAPFNYLDNRFNQQLKYLKENYQTEIHTRSAFLQGLFFMNPNNLHPFFEPLVPSLKEIEHLPNKAGSLLRYALVQPFIDKVVVGVNERQQLVHNINEIRRADIIKYIKEATYPEDCLMPSNWPKI